MALKIYQKGRDTIKEDWDVRVNEKWSVYEEFDDVRDFLINYQIPFLTEVIFEGLMFSFEHKLTFGSYVVMKKFVDDFLDWKHEIVKPEPLAEEGLTDCTCMFCKKEREIIKESKELELTAKMVRKKGGKR